MKKTAYITLFSFLVLILTITQAIPSEESIFATPAPFSRALTRLLDHGNQQLPQPPLPVNQTPHATAENIPESDAVFLPNRITRETLINLQRTNPQIERITVLVDGIEQEHYELIREYFPYAVIRAARITTFAMRREQINPTTLIWLTLINRFFNTFLIIDIYAPMPSPEELRLLRNFLPYTPLFFIINGQRIPLTIQNLLLLDDI